jgi:hypothetical protein
MLGPIVADQCLRDCFFAGTNSPVPQLCQHMGIPFTLQNRIDDRQAGQAGNIADDVMNLQVHLVQCFLHVLDVTTRHLNQVLAVTQHGAYCTDVLLGPK